MRHVTRLTITVFRDRLKLMKQFRVKQLKPFEYISIYIS